jgi:IrrE N-terminal-like domain
VADINHRAPARSGGSSTPAGRAREEDRDRTGDDQQVRERLDQSEPRAPGRPRRGFAVPDLVLPPGRHPARQCPLPKSKSPVCKAEAAVRARLNLARLVAIRVLEDIDVDTPARFPDPDVIFDSPSQAAAEVRRSWWLPPGPIDNVADAIEAAGGVVVPVDLGNDAVTAAYMQPMGDPVRWFFVNTNAAAGDRVRFALAHELGHAVVHTFDLLPENAEAEREAHEFAAALPSAGERPQGRIPARAPAAARPLGSEDAVGCFHAGDRQPCPEAWTDHQGRSHPPVQADLGVRVADPRARARRA